MKRLEDTFRGLLSEIGERPEREGLRDTPKRAARAWTFWTSGYQYKPGDILKTFEDGGFGYDEIIFQGNIPVYSHCEHHLAPFFGLAHIGYIPTDGKIVGLSKLSRLVDIYSRRVQVQERITVQVADAMQEYVNPQGVGVVLHCRHLCMESRGIQRVGTITTTSALKGAFREESSCRAEFMQMVSSAQSGSIL